MYLFRIPSRLMTLCILLLVVACKVSDSTTIRPTQTADLSTKTVVNSEATSVTSSPFFESSTTTIVETPVPAVSPTFTTLPTSEPTLTPYPTLSSEEAQELITTLLRDNGGCRLPCWWGFIPGQTKWREAENLLTPLASQMSISDSTSDSIFFVDVNIPVASEIFPVPLRHRYTVRNNIIEMIEVMLGNLPNYNLPSFLDMFGQPEEIWLKTYSQSREGSLPFTVVLFYPELGITIRYDDEAHEQEGQIVGCPQQYPALILAVWSIEENKSFEEVVNQTIEIGTFEEWAYLPLQEVTEMTITSFYETFKDSENESCLETPAEIWPDP